MRSRSSALRKLCEGAAKAKPGDGVWAELKERCIAQVSKAGRTAAIYTSLQERHIQSFSPKRCFKHLLKKTRETH